MVFSFKVALRLTDKQFETSKSRFEIESPCLIHKPCKQVRHLPSYCEFAQSGKPTRPLADTTKKDIRPSIAASSPGMTTFVELMTSWSLSTR